MTQGFPPGHCALGLACRRCPPPQHGGPRSVPAGVPVPRCSPLRAPIPPPTSQPGSSRRPSVPGRAPDSSRLRRPPLRPLSPPTSPHSPPCPYLAAPRARRGSEDRAQRGHLAWATKIEEVPA